MRIQNLNQYLGGANDVVAREYVNGTKRTQDVTITQGATNPMPLNLSGYTAQLDVVFATAASTASRGNLTISSLSMVANDQSFRTADGNTDSMVLLPGKDISSTVTFDADRSTGRVSIAWPGDLYEGYVPFNTDTNTPVAVATLRLANGANEAAASDIYSVRFLLFVRFGAIVA